MVILLLHVPIFRFFCLFLSISKSWWRVQSKQPVSRPTKRLLGSSLQLRSLTSLLHWLTEWRSHTSSGQESWPWGRSVSTKKSTELLIRKLMFQRALREIAQDFIMEIWKIFPSSWHVSYRLCILFCKKTRYGVYLFIHLNIYNTGSFTLLH